MSDRTERIMMALGDVRYMREYVIHELRRFDRLFSEKVYPPFADPEVQAERVAQEHWDQRMGEPVYDDNDVDPGSIADDAHDKSLAFYMDLWPMQVVVLNLFATGLYHLHEQQMFALSRRWGIDPSIGALRRWLIENLETDIRSAPMWPMVYELSLVANVVKHAEGRSSEELRQRNPVYFRHPGMRNEAFASIPQSDLPVHGPLTGEDIYVTKEDYDAFAQAVFDFWEWLASAVEEWRR